MKKAILILSLISGPAFGADLLNQKAQDGRSCRYVVTQVLTKHVGAPVRVLSYKSLTAGSFYQEYKAIFQQGGKSGLKTALLTGEYDCDGLQVEDIR